MDIKLTSRLLRLGRAVTTAIFVLSLVAPWYYYRTNSPYNIPGDSRIAITGLIVSVLALPGLIMGVSALSLLLVLGALGVLSLWLYGLLNALFIFLSRQSQWRGWREGFLLVSCIGIPALAAFGSPLEWGYWILWIGLVASVAIERYTYTVPAG